MEIKGENVGVDLQSRLSPTTKSSLPPNYAPNYALIGGTLIRTNQWAPVCHAPIYEAREPTFAGLPKRLVGTNPRARTAAGSATATSPEGRPRHRARLAGRRFTAPPKRTANTTSTSTTSPSSPRLDGHHGAMTIYIR